MLKKFWSKTWCTKNLSVFEIVDYRDYRFIFEISVYGFGDKSRNMYSTNAKYYNKLTISCFTTIYKKSDDNIIAKIDNKS